MPREFLRGKTLDTGVSQEAGQRRWKAKTVRQHVFGAGPAEFATEKSVSVKHLPKDRFCGGRVDVALFHGRTRRKPPSRLHVGLELAEIGGVVFHHHAIAVGAAEVENIMWVLLEQVEILMQSVRKILAYGFRIFPSPLCIQMRVPNNIERWSPAEIDRRRGR